MWLLFGFVHRFYSSWEATFVLHWNVGLVGIQPFTVGEVIKSIVIRKNQSRMNMDNMQEIRWGYILIVCICAWIYDQVLSTFVALR